MFDDMKRFLFLILLIYSLNGNTQETSKMLDSITNSCICNEYTLSLHTYFLKDSVITNELLWQKPTIVSQEISLYKNNFLLKKHKITNRQIHILTKDGFKMEISQIPIIDVAFIKGNKTFIYLYGALNCNGINCPEYFAIYDLSGNKCIDFISTDINNQYEHFEKIISKYGLDLQKQASRTTILDKLVW